MMLDSNRTRTAGRSSDGLPAHLRADRIPKHFPGIREGLRVRLIIQPIVMHRSMHAGRERRSRDRAQLGDGRQECNLFRAQIAFLRARRSVGFCRAV